MNEENLRKKAIQLYLNNRTISYICKELKRSRQWFYKWLQRFKLDPKGEWYQELTRKPKTIHKSITPDTEQLIIKIRKELENEKYAQIGAINIQWAFHRLGLKPPPIWTIDRVLRKNNLTRKKSKIKKRVNEYPGDKYANVQQLDLVGPRFIKNYGRFYSINIMDIENRCAQINPIKNKSAEYILEAITRFWRTFGIPDFLQLDNEMSFRGSNRYPHSFGKIIRFALLHEVTPIFIPQAEPWRNGVIEKFNDTFDKKFFRIQNFTDLKDICNKAPEFEIFHNTYYRYKAIENKTPLDMFRMNPPIKFLDRNYTIPQIIPLIDGDIIIIRFVRSDRKLNIFGESYLVSKDLVYSYVEAIITVKGQALKVFRDNTLFHTFQYLMPVDWL